jgi:hypothetical protein
MRALRGLHPVRVENPACAGTPDINFTNGWIENKFIARWPSDPHAVLKCPHFTPQQRVWHIQRTNAGGLTWFCLQVERTVLLFTGWDAAHSLGKAERAELETVALGVWENKLDDKRFVQLVTEK